MISLLTDTFRVRPNSEPNPAVQPTLVLESPLEGHPTTGKIVDGESGVHAASARSRAIAAPPFK
jgi:hypothetical protein